MGPLGFGLGFKNRLFEPVLTPSMWTDLEPVLNQFWTRRLNQWWIVITWVRSQNGREFFKPRKNAEYQAMDPDLRRRDLNGVWEKILISCDAHREDKDSLIDATGPSRRVRSKHGKNLEAEWSGCRGFSKLIRSAFWGIDLKGDWQRASLLIIDVLTSKVEFS